jgi:signal transduction histidine kinase
MSAIAARLSVLVPSLNLSEFGEVLHLPRKTTVIQLRWPVVIISAYLLLTSHKELPAATLVHGLLILYILSNVVLQFLDERLFDSSSFYTPLVIFDTLFITASLITVGQIGTDFFLAFFLIIILSSICRDFRGSILIAVLGPLIYGYILLGRPEAHDPGTYLGLFLPFVVALFYGYFAQIVTAEKNDRIRVQPETINTAIAIQNSQLVDQNKTLKDKLDRADSAKLEFLSVVTHELRTPLQLITGYAEILQERLLGDINQEQENAVVRLMKSSHELRDIIDNVLELMKIDSGTIKESKCEVKVKDILDELRRASLGPVDKDVVLSWDYPSSLPGNTDWMLRVILTNLINNAIKYTNDGSVQVSARYHDLIQSVEFKVADTGMGIPKESLTVIFDMFGRVDTSLVRPSGSTGLGLFIVKRFSELLGGTVKVESEPGKGSTFTVMLPVALETSASSCGKHAGQTETQKRSR